MATGDLITLATLKTRLETSSNESDDVLSAVITNASHAIRLHTGRQFFQETGATRVVQTPGFWPEVGIRVPDLQAITGAVTIRDRDTTTTKTLAAADFVLEPQERPAGEPATFMRAKSTVDAGLDSGYSVQIIGTFGWAAVPAAVEEAAVQVCRSWLRQDATRFAGVIEGGDGYPVVAVPAATWMLPMSARQLLRPFRIWGVG